MALLTEQEWERLYEAADRIRRERGDDWEPAPQFRPRWQEVAELQEQGWRPKEIAEFLGFSLGSVYQLMHVARSHAARAVPYQGPRNRAEQMAAVYDDPARQDWILKRMADLAARRRQRRAE